jgi:hypothetical protein
MGKKSPCPMKAIAEICIHFNKRDLARTIFVDKISDVDEKIQLLIEYSFWEDAIKIVFATKKQDEYLEQIKRKGDSSV